MKRIWIFGLCVLLLGSMTAAAAALDYYVDARDNCIDLRSHGFTTDSQ